MAGPDASHPVMPARPCGYTPSTMDPGRSFLLGTPGALPRPARTSFCEALARPEIFTGGGCSMTFRRLTVPLLAALAFATIAAEAGAQPCLIFVHGKQTNTNTYTSYSAARNYWVSGSNDFIRTATKNFATSYYVVGYNGTRPYWDAQ